MSSQTKIYLLVFWTPDMDIEKDEPIVTMSYTTEEVADRECARCNKGLPDFHYAVHQIVLRETSIS